MDRNWSRLIWEGFLEEWPGPATIPWSEARAPLPRESLPVSPGAMSRPGAPARL